MLQKYEERLGAIKKMLLDLGSDITMAGEKASSGIENLDLTRFESARTLLKNVEMQANAIDNEIVVALALFGRRTAEIVDRDQQIA